MLYYLFEYLNQAYDLPGSSLFKYLTFRASVAAIMGLAIAILFGRRVILFLKSRQIGETIRELGPASHKAKSGTPTMGGVIILAAIVIPTLLLAKLHSGYVLLALIATVWMGLIGFLDDYIKIFKKNKSGLPGKFKIVAQVLLGLLAGLIMTFHPDFAGADPTFLTSTNLPFVKDYELDYSRIAFWSDDPIWGRIIYVGIVIFIITAVSNGVNLTDGLDGLAAGTTAIVAVALGIFAYVSGNVVFAKYLNITYLPNSGETVVFVAALIAACVGFLWYNTYPAQVFMGDTGSLALGGAVGMVALMVKKELLLPLLCGVFFVESLSVILQVAYFKYTKRKYGEGRRIFRMAPLHHHYEKMGHHETKIVVRFWIVTLILVILSFATLKIR
jgi:phospho-N-acetylmuramoyl-pentapeptide-transferase